MQQQSRSLFQRGRSGRRKGVKANRGAPGVDGQWIEAFEEKVEGATSTDLESHVLGAYFPPPVLRVEIPKPDGGRRTFGIPTVGDRVAQEVVRNYLEPRVEPVFHPDSYGYRPGKSAPTRSGKPGSGVGGATGCSTSTSGLLRQNGLRADDTCGAEAHGLSRGCCCTWSDG